MKRLVIIFAVLIVGLTISTRDLDFQKMEIIPLAAKAEKTPAPEKTPDAPASTEKKDAADKPVDANSPDASPAMEKEDTDEPVDANSTDAPPTDMDKGRGTDRGRGRGRGTGGGMDRAAGMGMDRNREGMDRSRDMDSRGAVRNPKQAEDPNDPFVAINLNNIEMKNILTKLAAWTGKVIIPTDEAMRVKITIYADKEVPRSEALTLIFDALRNKSIIAEISDNKIYLKPISEAKLGYVPVLTADEPIARIKDKSQLVEKYFRLKHTSPSKLVSVITPLTASYGHVTAYESSSTLAVIDTVENLFRIEQTIAQFDIPESDQVVEKIFEIKNGDALEIVQVFELVFQESKGGSSRSSSRSSSHPPSQPSPASKGGASAPATSVIVQAGEIPIVLLPIPKHNWIIARASADDMEKIEVWIDKLDVADSSPQEQTIIPILHVDPAEVERLVEKALDSMPGSELKTSVVVKAMQDAKQIVVFGSEENRKFVERLIMDIDLPVEDIYEHKDFKLKHADPDEVKTNLEGLYESEAGNVSSYSYNRGSSSSRYKKVDPKDVVKVMSFPALKQLSVVATPEKLAIIEAQIKEWDVPMDVKENQYLLITLNNSDPVQMVELLSTLFSEEDSSSSSSFMRMIFGRGDEADSKKKIVGSLYGLLTFQAVPGTKKILVISKVPEAYPVIESLVKDLDSQEKGEVPRVITLNYADPEELCDQLNAILTERGMRATLKRREQGLSATDFNSTDNSSSGTSSNNTENQNDPGEITPWWTSGREDDTEMPLSNLIGKIRFIPVHRSKAILALAPPEYYEDIEKMVMELDQPEMQVMIEAVIVEVDHSSMTSLGVQLSSNPNLLKPIGLNSFDGLSADFDFSKAVSKGLTLTAGTNIDALIDLLAKTVNAKILNQPNLWTKDNEEAIFFKGKKISLLSSNQQSPTGSIQNNYSPEPVGVTLKVRPNITPAKDVDITIELEISDLAADLVNSQPVINRMVTSTNLIIANGETIMLGGILFQNESEIKSKVPLLGDIPILGALFSHEDTSLRNSELLIFLTPHVVTDKKTEAEKKFIIEPDSKIQSLEGSKYMNNPAERMLEIRKSLNEALLKGLMN
ncbi:MAG: hypothetical protein K9M75_07470 [Phycisphaerae bacterium]|nr:hypothetical protein [Phycisphaerae bacterium]